jgi:hypothetical protein
MQRKGGAAVEHNRFARVRVSTGILQQVLRGEGLKTCNNTMSPADLQVLGVEQPHHAIGQFFYVVVTSKRFKKIKEGEDIPIIEPFIYHINGGPQ